MSRRLLSPSGLYHAVRDQLGSIRRVYGRGNAIVRRGDFGQHDEIVLLLHGFMQTRNVWDVMEDRLRYDGFGVFSLDLGGLFRRFNNRPIAVLAEAISEKLEGVCAKHGMDRFHIVGHSKGGLVARHYIQHHGGDRRVKSLVTLGTPHRGTPTAALGVWLMGGGLLSRSPIEMLPRSAMVRRLGRDTFPAQVPMTSVYSRHDVVCPHWCSKLMPREGESSMRNISVDRVGHTELCYDPGVYQIVRAELQEAAELWRERTGCAAE
ncbi:MAG: alpha/beta fold hydrolase [Myxococcota bacterium]|nr:alpha/beta fold hydrolase [Myxococcota bacterium]